MIGIPLLRAGFWRRMWVRELVLGRAQRVRMGRRLWVRALRGIWLHDCDDNEMRLIERARCDMLFRER